MYDAETKATRLPLESRAAQGRFSAVPRPFLRWAGSKQALLQYIQPLLPSSYARYYEPFLGSGALFFHLIPKRASLSDSSSELIAVYEALRNDVQRIADYLRPLRPDRGLYYKIRSNRSADPIIRAAEFLYLNKTCWNGLYRVNSRGDFNVPYGSPRTDFIFDEANLLACAATLKGEDIRVRQMDFARGLSHARENDLVYLDPPYVTGHNNNGFRDWNETLFRWSDQVKLSVIAQRLRRQGTSVVVSNANHRDVLALYEGFDQHVVNRSSSLSGKTEFRGPVTEVILTANVAERK